MRRGKKHGTKSAADPSDTNANSVFVRIFEGETSSTRGGASTWSSPVTPASVRMRRIVSFPASDPKTLGPPHWPHGTRKNAHCHSACPPAAGGRASDKDARRTSTSAPLLNLWFGVGTGQKSRPPTASAALLPTSSGGRVASSATGSACLD